MDYYKRQLDYLKDTVYDKSVVVSDGDGNKTNTLTLNSESIPVLIEFLKKELKEVKKRRKNG